VSTQGYEPCFRRSPHPITTLFSVPKSDPDLPSDVATIVNPSAWQGRAQQLAVLLGAASRQPPGLKVVRDPGGPPVPGSPVLAIVSDPDYWTVNQAELDDALHEPALGSASHSLGSGAVSEGVERLTLTVEEAAVSLASIIHPTSG
jgi:hypothetical protein